MKNKELKELKIIKFRSMLDKRKFIYEIYLNNRNINCFVGKKELNKWLNKNINPQEYIYKESFYFNNDNRYCARTLAEISKIALRGNEFFKN